MGCSKSSSKREDYSTTSLPQKTNQKKSQINNQTIHLKELEKEKQTKSKVNIKEEIIKIRTKINVIETKKIEKINETES